MQQKRLFLKEALNRAKSHIYKKVSNLLLIFQCLALLLLLYRLLDIDFSERETGGIDYEILPNIGGCRLQNALAAIHMGGLPRPVKFSGYYQDSVLSEISTAKDWKLDAQSSSASETTLNNTYNSSEISGWTGSFNQLLADKKSLMQHSSARAT